MKKLIILTVFLGSASSLAALMDPCGDNRTNISSRSTALGAKEYLAALVGAKDDSKMLVARIFLNSQVITVNKLSYIPSLAVAALTGNRSALEAQIIGECDYSISAENFRLAAAVVAQVRAQLAK